MPAAKIAIRRLPQRLSRDATHVITRFLWPGNPERAENVIRRVLELSESEVSRLLDSCIADFGHRHDDLGAIFEDHFEEAIERLDAQCEAGPERRHLIGAYFTMEYSYASAALFNPSMVPSLDQDGTAAGSTRFVMSLRAVGEGHISSILFREGTLDAGCDITFRPMATRSRRMKVVEGRTYEKALFLTKLVEASAYSEPTGDVLQHLGDTFTLSELTTAISTVRKTLDQPYLLDEPANLMLWVAHSNYELQAPANASLSEFVVFPHSENESNGLEDMRLVLFTDDDGSQRYYGTYTAYNGSRIIPQLIEARGDRRLKVHTLGGRFAVDKGMALFPRKLGGWYTMISRVDGENLYLMRSRSVRFWNDAEMIQQPRFPWEFVQIGNCGSPLETDAGWLLLTHGVGPMRRYAIAATLLDLEDPSKVIGQLSEPLLLPLADERHGYVPNVVYSCGGMIHNDTLVIPYGISDVECGFATVSLDELLDALTEKGR